MKKSKKIFLDLPELLGGKEAFKKYIKTNLKYPGEALNRKVQGIVYLSAEINDNGEIGQIIVEKGLGAGCDEEAIRLIENVQFGWAKNRGMRVKTRKKFRIEFKLPPQRKINYTITEKTDIQESKNKYSYTIPIK